MKRLLLLGLTTLALGSGCKVVVSGCVTSRDCAAGFVCSTAGTCVSTTAVDHTYVSCFNNNGCDADDGCFYVEIPTTGTFGKYCSHNCTAASQCEQSFGFAGQCYSLPPDMTQLCYQRCSGTPDCYSGNKCTMVLVTTGVKDMICMPNNSATP